MTTVAKCYSLLAMNTSETVSTCYLDRLDGRIAYDIRGDAESPLVLLVPGMGDPRSTFRFQVEPLAAAGFRVVTMDLRGHGDSDVTFTAYDDEALAGDVTALVEHLGGPATVVGNSMGAGAAVIAAAERPDLVSRLVLIGAFVRDPALNPVVSALFRVLTLRPWVRTVWRAYLPSLYAGTKPADFAAYRDAVHADLGKPGHARAFSATTRTTHAPAEAVASQVEVPTLVVMGDRDPDFPDPAAEARWITETLAGPARSVMVEDAGHYPHSQHPDRVNVELLHFLRA